MSLDLTTEIAGVKLRNPLIAASGPPTATTERMVRLIKAGAAAVVTKTASYDPEYQRSPRPRFNILHKEALKTGFFSLHSVELAARFAPEEIAHQVMEVKKLTKVEDCAVIASIAGRNEEEWIRLAEKMADAGADMLELNLSCPHTRGVENSLWGREAGSDPKACEFVIRTVKKASGIPVIGKITPDGANPVQVALGMLAGGADALVATARFSALLIDVELEAPPLWGGYGGYGGPWMLPMSCRWVARLKEAGVKVPIIGSGGVYDWKDVVSLLLVGAEAIQVCTAVIVKGAPFFEEILDGLKNWMLRKGYGSLKDFIGKALPRIVPFGSLDRKTMYEAHVDEARCTGCLQCIVSCPFDAIQIRQRKAFVDPGKCDGCGLCVSICPVGAPSLLSKP
ncbi:MAG: 4Fe-4S binding protein [Candidatus Bathyarchaeia archaeon]